MKTIHKNETITYFQIASTSWGMYHPETFQTEQEARDVINTKYNNRAKNDGYDNYWNSKTFVVIKITKIIEVLN